MRKVSTVPFQALVRFALADHVLEVDAELAQQQVVGVEAALVEIEDVVGSEIEQVAGLFDDVLVDHAPRSEPSIVGDAVEQGLQVVGAALEHRPGPTPAAVVGHQPVAAGAVFLRRGRRGPAATRWAATARCWAARSGSRAPARGRGRPGWSRACGRPDPSARC